ncbi:hypothetical protein MKX03_006116 [Papaver bracteatum]|nr:hypothetical protein MKX03_006116 [Papaver bracteatum]
MEAQPIESALSSHASNYLSYTNQDHGVIDINNSQGFSMDFPILLEDNSENRLSTQELNLINSIKVGSSSASPDKSTYEETEIEEEEANPRGHQNAHKQERIVEKSDRLHRLTSYLYSNMMSNHQHHPYNLHLGFSRMSYLPLHGSLGYNRSLSVQAHSASDSSYLYGQHHSELLSPLRKPPIMGHQPSIGRLPSFLHGFLMQNSGGVGGGVCLKGTSSSHQEDSKKIDLALKL